MLLALAILSSCFEVTFSKKVVIKAEIQGILQKDK